MLNVRSETEKESWLDYVDASEIYEFAVSELRIMDPVIQKKVDDNGAYYFEIKGLSEHVQKLYDDTIVRSLDLTTLYLGAFGPMKKSHSGNFMTDADALFSNPSAYKEYIKFVDEKNIGRRINEKRYTDNVRNLFETLNKRIKTEREL